MAEEWSAPLVSVFRQAREDHHYNLRLLDEHRLAEGQITDEQANDNVVVAMVADDSGFQDKQRPMYKSIHIVHDIRREQWWLRILRAERDALFAETNTETDEEETQA